LEALAPEVINDAAYDHSRGRTRYTEPLLLRAWIGRQ
jgi:hypothetical protein